MRWRQLALAAVIVTALAATACGSSLERGPMAGQRFATLVTEGASRARGIYPVQIYKLDGREINTQQTIHRIEPGVHTIQARALADWGLSQTTRRTARREPPPVLEFNFQSGRRYFLGMKAPEPGETRWQLVIYRTEDVEEGTIRIDG
ncbi:MAG: hypothetical protein QNJ40_13420 [Xanthomonadales bacterium]|nr:hypothetical protein [Xanthomonadales bacterium]